MKKYLFLPFLFLLITSNISAQTQLRQCQEAIVYGKIVNQTDETPKVITILACNPLSDEDRFASRIDASGLFQVKFEMLWGHSFTINYDKQFINLYSNPGDSIYIEIDATKFHLHKKNAIVFSGDNAQKNAEFSQAFNDLVGMFRLSCTDYSLPLTKFMKVIKADNDKLNDSISSYCKERKMSSWTQKMIQDMSLYSLANFAMDYKGQTKHDALDFFKQPIFDVYNPAKFATMMFPYHISALRNALFRNDPLIIGYAKKNDLVNIEKRGVRLLMAMPKSLTRDVMLFNFYKKLKGGELELDVQDFSHKAIFEKLVVVRNKQRIVDLPELKSGKGAFLWLQNGKIENIKNFKLKELVNGEYRDKVIYLDVWATWCGPCRAEMAPARELHKLFHDKEVVFINICLKSKQKAWAKMIANGEVEGINYFFDADLSSEAAASLLSVGFPTYILIGKDGKIRTKKAPRPSSISLVAEKLDKLLAE